MNDAFNREVISFNTSGVNGTFAIGASFIFIAYILQPAVESAYQRVRAYRAWRAIENRQAVEVTNYPMLEEICKGRGKWDTARGITVLLAVLHLLSWGLELSMDLAYHKGDADILNRSPPILVEEASDGTSTWKVTSEAFFDTERVWESLSNVGEGSAQSKYNIVRSDVCGTGYIDGEINVALWVDSTEPANVQLHYLLGGGGAPTVTSLECKAGTQSNMFNITSVEDDVSNGDDNSGDGNVYWGSGVECESGPELEGYDTSDTPPTLILHKTYHRNNTDGGNTTDEVSSTDGEVYLVVEESSNYPSFLYSVWTALGNTDGKSIELTREFHIASTMRLAEAVVTGIVHGQINGRYCFELVRMYSESGAQSDVEVTRAEPFGEHFTNDTVLIENIENIECGLEIDRKAAVFCACLIMLTAVGIAWAGCLESSIGMDIYNRDELIRAVSMPGVTGTCAAPSSIRIFVRKEDTGSMSVAVTDTGDAGGGCARVFRLGGKVVEDTSPAPLAAAATVEQYNHGYGGAAVPVGPRTVWLEGVRTGMGRPLPGRNGDFQYPSVALSASPVPSNACSLVATPFHTPPPLARVPRGDLGFVPRGGGGITARRGASVLFDDQYSSDDSGLDEPADIRSGRSDGIERGGTPSVRIAVAVSGMAAEARPLGAHPTLIEGSSWVDRGAGNGAERISSGSTTFEASPRTPSPPPLLLRREQTFGPAQVSSIIQDSDRELIGSNSSFHIAMRASH